MINFLLFVSLITWLAFIFNPSRINDIYEVKFIFELMNKPNWNPIKTIALVKLKPIFIVRSIYLLVDLKKKTKDQRSFDIILFTMNGALFVFNFEDFQFFAYFAFRFLILWTLVVKIKFKSFSSEDKVTEANHLYAIDCIALTVYF